MEIVKQNEHINIIFTGDTPSGKTSVYTVLSRSRGQVLGIISWFSPWRQYCFAPANNIVCSSSCLDLVVEFLKEINKAHKS